MKKSLKQVAGGVAGSGILVASTFGIASADTSNTNVGSSGIPKTVFKQERLQAESEVLHTSTDSITTAHKDKSFSKLLDQAHLSKKDYAEKLKAQLTTDLKAKGYSQDQITIALQQRHINRMHHKEKSGSKKT